MNKLQKPLRTWSHYQEAIFAGVVDTTDNMVVSACPGSGKTTTLQEVWNRSQGPMVYLAFNVANVQEAKTKLTPGEGRAVLTLNGLGHKAAMAAFPEATLVKDKVYKLIRTWQDRLSKHGKWDYAESRRNTPALGKCVGLMKCFDPACVRTDVAVARLIDDYDLDTYPGMASHALRIYEQSLRDTERIDFADQLLFPVYFGLDVPYFPTVLLDEGQDLNEIQFLLVGAISQEEHPSRYIIVGDKRQAIYGFRGAMAGSLMRLGDHFHCKEYPLKLSYRCPKLIVSEAQQYYPDDIEALASAPDGIVRKDVDLGPQAYTPTDLIVCRNNAPLVALAYDLLRHDIACQVRGRDIGENLINYVRRLEPTSLSDARSKVCEDMDAKLALAQERKQWDKVQSLQDKYATLDCFLGNCHGTDVDVLYQHIASLFENGRGVTLSTVHKAKGLEAEKVMQLRFDLLPSPYAHSSEAKEQERNLQYVAVTRSKGELTYLR